MGALLTGILAAACVLTLLWPLARFISTTAAWLDYPYPRSGSEGLILYETLLVRQGSHPYVPITPEQFISGPYPPVYYWLAAWVLPAHLPGFSEPYHVESFFRPGRVISLLAALVAAGLVVLLVVFDGGYDRMRMGRRAVWLAAMGGVMGGGLMLTLPQVMVWASRFRGDMLMVALTAAGLTCIAFARPNPRLFSAQSLALMLGAGFFSLAFFTKQTALAGPIAAAAFLLLRDRKLGLRWCVLMGVMVVVPFVALDLLTGHWFYLKMVEYHSLPLRVLTLTRLVQMAFWEDQWPLILIAAGYMLYRIGRLMGAGRTPWLAMVSKGPDRPALAGRAGHTSLLIPLFALASFATLPTGAVVGADHNHLLMSGLAISACVGALFARLLWKAGSGRSGPVHLAVAAVAASLVVVYNLVTSAPSSWYDADLLVPHPLVQEQMRLIVHNVRQHPATTFFSDDPGIIALAGKRTPYDDPFTMTALALQNRWDESAFRRMLRNGDFGLLVLSCDVINEPQGCRSDIFTPGVRDAIRDGYQLLFRDVFYTYAPRRE
jgi:hypothetical protein